MKSRRISRRLSDLPGLFDNLDIDQSFTVTKPEPHDFALRPVSEAVQRVDPESVKPGMVLRMLSMGSGSSGNCTYIGTPSSGLLIDAGVDQEKVMRVLAQNAVDPASIHGILVTHDHADHVRYAYGLLRRNRKWRLYTTPRVLGGMLRRHSISRRINDYHTAIYKEFEARIGDFTVIPFETSHDGSDNMGFAISADGVAGMFVIMTDTGKITERADFYMRRATDLMIETNYDAEMLRVGPYPEYLKARIASAIGHMDNVDTAEYLASMWHPGLRRIFLCHLSHDNNRPATALDAVRTALERVGVTVGDGSGSAEMSGRQVQLMALPRYDATDLIKLI